MSRPDRRRQGLGGGVVALAVAWVTALPNATTYAAWSDFATIPGSAGAGVWLTDGDPPLPAQCLGMFFDRIIIGTNKDDVLTGTAGNDLIFGLQGKDVLHGLAGQDCLVGGNGKDELLGGDGDDVLVGGNAKDNLNGGTDDDVCDGGRGKNTLVQCAPATSAATTFLDLTAPTATTNESVLVLNSTTGAEPDVESKVEPSPETGSGASVEDPPEAPLVEPAVVEPAETVQPVVEQPEDVVPTEPPTVEVQP